jgi:hypothetical protein
MANVTARQKLVKLPPTSAGLPRYGHPNGFVIERERRSWSERNGNQVGGGVPLHWWGVHNSTPLNSEKFKPYGTLRRALGDTFETLAEAREWCDRNRGRFA